MAGTEVDLQLVRMLTAHRTAAKLTQQALADNMTQHGIPWTRSLVASLEKDRRQRLQLSEILTLCLIYKITLPQLLVEVGVPDEQISKLTGLTTDKIELEAENAALRDQISTMRVILDQSWPDRKMSRETELETLDEPSHET